MSNTTDKASATTPQAGESADTTSASTVGGGLSDKSKTRGVEPAAGAEAEQQEKRQEREKRELAALRNIEQDMGEREERERVDGG